MKYEDIIYLKRPSSKRLKMSMSDRAAQFSPFAALTGYDDQVKETARIVDEKYTLDEESLILLDRNIREIQKKIQEKPEVMVTYFINDEKKFGGMYVDEIKKAVKIDPEKRVILFEDNKSIELDDIYSLEIKK